MFTDHVSVCLRRCLMTLAMLLGVGSGLPDQLSMVLAAEPGIVGVAAGKITDTDWPWWRGPYRNGIAPSSAHPPRQWSAEHRQAWAL